MTYESVCGHCHERLLVESTANRAACPHCGTVLIVPDDETSLQSQPTLEPATSDEQPPAFPQVEHAASESESAAPRPALFDSSVIRAADAPPSSTPDFSKWSAASSSTMTPAGFPNLAETHDKPAETIPVETPPAETAPDFTPAAAAPAPAPAKSSAPKETAPAVAATGAVASAGKATTTKTATSAAASRSGKSNSSKSTADTVPRKSFQLLLIYASMVTAVCLGLLFLQLTRRSHELESLPDVVPPRDSDGVISHILAPANAPLPEGHVLTLGQTQRFGNLLVTPTKVTRESLGFTHRTDGDAREPAGQVLKLWLQLENVGSDGRSFAPLDGNLLFYRGPSTAGAYVLKANNFLAPADRSPGSLIAVYDHPPESDWNLAGQNLGSVLAPGESMLTYIPTETGVSTPDGPLAWRVHLRKGIADNGWGVTTLVEVTFDATDVQGS